MEVSMPDNTLFRKSLLAAITKENVAFLIENLEAEKRKASNFPAGS